MSDSLQLSKRVEAALLAAKRAGAYLLETGRTADFTITQKAANDFVTDADTNSEAIIIQTIKEHFPHDAIFAEESGKAGESGQGRWIIDPIDGTMNFSRSIPGYTISIAWELDPYEPLVGVVFNPCQDELFWAYRGGGAYLNGEAITVSSVTDPKGALIATVPPHRHHDHYDHYAQQAKRLALGTSDFRSYGSCALEMAYIAAGRIDAYYEMWLGYYDMAAGLALVREAGGVVEPADPKVPFSDGRCDVVASNGLIHPHILHMVQQ